MSYVLGLINEKSVISHGSESEFVGYGEELSALRIELFFP
jgi:hypothetical protein